MEQGGKLCDEVEVVKECIYLGDRVSAGGCEAGVTVGTRCEWLMFRECHELFYGIRSL